MTYSNDTKSAHFGRSPDSVPSLKSKLLLAHFGNRPKNPPDPIFLPFPVPTYYHAFVMINFQVGTGPLWVFLAGRRTLSLVASIFIGEVTQPWPLARTF